MDQLRFLQTVWMLTDYQDSDTKQFITFWPLIRFGRSWRPRKANDITQLFLRDWIPRFCLYRHENLRPNYWTERELSIDETRSTKRNLLQLIHLNQRRTRDVTLEESQEDDELAPQRWSPHLSTLVRQQGAPTARKGGTNGGWRKEAERYCSRGVL